MLINIQVAGLIACLYTLLTITFYHIVTNPRYLAGSPKSLGFEITPIPAGIFLSRFLIFIGIIVIAYLLFDPAIMNYSFEILEKTAILFLYPYALIQIDFVLYKYYKKILSNQTILIITTIQFCILTVLTGLILFTTQQNVSDMLNTLDPYLTTFHNVALTIIIIIGVIDAICMLRKRMAK